MAQSRRVRISNSTLNSYGTRVLTEGVDLEQYKRNPILLWMHSRAWAGRKDDVLPIGTVKDIEVVGDDIFGELVFDEKDEFGKQIAQKWDDGILKMVSPNFDPVAFDEDPDLALPGQTRATVTKSKLIELSVVDIGGNDDNMALLSRSGKELKLSEGGACVDIPALQSINNKNQNDMDLKAISLKLGLPEGSTEDDVLGAINILLGYKTANETLRQEKETMQLASITTMVKDAISVGKMGADKEAQFIELGKKSGADTLKLVLDTMQKPIRPMAVIGAGTGSGIALAGDYKKLSDVPSEALAELRENDKTTYMKLYKAEYGVECKI